ncbi:MAG: HDIG domain-containing protein [Candidatus Bathyarchaeia archaeon]
MNHDEAIELVKTNIKHQNIFLHMVAVEAIMKALAQHLKEDEILWGLAGLLHDIDFEETAKSPERHGILAQEILKGKVPDEILRAIKAHNSKYSGVFPQSNMEKALIASDAVSGLIIACALVMPSKKVKDISVETVKKKFKDKDFARGADRNRIALCREIGMTLEEFFKIALEGIRNVSQELGI